MQIKILTVIINIEVETTRGLKIRTIVANNYPCMPNTLTYRKEIKHI